MYQAHYKPTKFIAGAMTAMGVLSLMPFAIAQQRDQVTVNQDAGGPNVSVSASAISRGSGSADGLGAGAGMGRGNSDGDSRGFGFGGAMTRSKSQSRGGTSISISTNPAQGAPKPATQSQMNLEKPSRMKQSMISGNTGAKDAWTRTTEATLNGDNITIVEKPNTISLTLEHPDGTEEVFVAKDLRDLAIQSRTAAAIYRKLLNRTSTPGNNMGIAANPGNNMPFDARVLLRQQIQSMKDEQGSQGAAFDLLLNDLDALGR